MYVRCIRSRDSVSSFILRLQRNTINGAVLQLLAILSRDSRLSRTPVAYFYSLQLLARTNGKRMPGLVPNTPFLSALRSRAEGYTSTACPVNDLTLRLVSFPVLHPYTDSLPPELFLRAISPSDSPLFFHAPILFDFTDNPLLYFMRKCWRTWLE